MKIVVARGDGWEGVYINGQLFTEDHQIDWISVLQKLNISVIEKHVNYYWLDEQGGLPSQLEDVCWEGDYDSHL